MRRLLDRRGRLPGARLRRRRPDLRCLGDGHVSGRTDGRLRAAQQHGHGRVDQRAVDQARQQLRQPARSTSSAPDHASPRRPTPSARSAPATRSASTSRSRNAGDGTATDVHVVDPLPTGVNWTLGATGRHDRRHLRRTGARRPDLQRRLDGCRRQLSVHVHGSDRRDRLRHGHQHRDGHGGNDGSARPRPRSSSSAPTSRSRRPATARSSRVSRRRSRSPSTTPDPAWPRRATSPTRCRAASPGRSTASRGLLHHLGAR